MSSRRGISVFQRMIATIIVLCTLVIALFWIVFSSLNHQTDSVVSPNLQHPLSMMIAHQLDNGVKTIEEVESELPVEITEITGHDSQLADVEDSHATTESEHITINIWESRSFQFYWKDHADIRYYEDLSIAMLIAAIFLFITAYFYIKRVLSPIGQIQDSVELIAQGDFDVKTPVNSSNEFGRLALAFNTMSDKIKGMIRQKDQLLSDVSHELNTPVTRMRLAAELMEESEEKDSIISDLTEVKSLIENLLESNRLDYGFEDIRKSQVDIGQVLLSLTAEFDSKEKPIVLTKAQAPCIILGNESLLRVLFRNLIDNAIKYSFKNDHPVYIKMECVNSDCQIKIKDSGEGIPQEKIDKLFEPFYRIEGSRSKQVSGFGLGLHLSRKIVEAHSGSISIQNIEPHGIEVSVVLTNQ